MYKTGLKNEQLSQYFIPDSNLTAKPANLKVYHKAPQDFFMRGFKRGFADTFIFVVRHTDRLLIILNIHNKIRGS